jgi:hypothetical protein
MDQIIEAIASVLMFAHVGAFVWAGWLRKGIAPVLALNMLVSAGVVVYWAMRITELMGWMAPGRHLSAKMVFIEVHQRGSHP